VTYKKKLIEAALPLDAFHKASAREKSIRHGHPSPLHLWWAGRPLATLWGRNRKAQKQERPPLAPLNSGVSRTIQPGSSVLSFLGFSSCLPWPAISSRRSVSEDGSLRRRRLSSVFCHLSSDFLAFPSPFAYDRSDFLPGGCLRHSGKTVHINKNAAACGTIRIGRKSDVACCTFC
jgi:hypothetical protein